MLHLRRNSQPSDDFLEKSTTSYRRTSIPPIIPTTTPPIALPNNLLNSRRLPLAPLDPQSTNFTHPALDQISTSSFVRSSASERTELARYNIGRPIIPHRTSSADSSMSLQGPRRKSIPNQYASRIIPTESCADVFFSTQANNGISRPSASTQTRTMLRRPSHTPSASVDSSRRPSLPTIHLQPTPLAVHASSTASSSTSYANPDFTLLSSDDMYSNLASFTFGAARPSRPEMVEVNPLASVSGSVSRDRTPRPSVSGPSSGSSYPGHTSCRNRSPRTQDKDVDGNGDTADDEDDEEVIRQSRYKMRAMNDGSRRPSLPVNTYRPGRSTSPSNSSAPKISPQRSTVDVYDHDHNGIEGTSDVDGHSGAPFGEGGHEDGDFDTDVELDFPHHYGSRSSLVSDVPSQHTFGGGSRHDRKGDSENKMSIVSEDHDMFDQRTTAAISLSQSRRGSVPWNIPSTSTSGSTNRDREDSATTLHGRRFSRSLDDTPSMLAVGGSANSYSTSGIEPMSTETQSLPSHQSFTPMISDAGGSGDAYDGLDISYILGSPRMDDIGISRSWSSGAPSYNQSHEDGADGASPQRRHVATLQFPPWAFPSTGGRRPSAVTVSSASGEDAFTRAIRRIWDTGYAVRRDDWSFKREFADGNGPAVIPASPPVPGSGGFKTISPGTQEIWRQVYVGRYKVDRLMMRPDDPAKPPQQRVNVRHIMDPYSRGNIRGGPTTVIHKHSRALAFSIFRKYGLLGKGMRSTSHNTSGSILLATRRVQEQYTSTRTTSQLNSHGLLRDGDHDSGRGEVDSQSSHNQRHPKTKKDKARKEKGKKVADAASSGTGTSSQTTSLESSTGSVSSSTTDSERKPGPTGAYASSSSIPISPTVVENPRASDIMGSSTSSVSDTTLTTRDATDGPSSLHDHTPSRSYLHSYGDDDELMLPRTSHAEAFATLDSSSIEYLRGRFEQRFSDHDSALSGLERWRRRLLGQNARGALRTPSGPPSASLEGHYTPPWLTMAPRSKQEERERVIQNLNESFKDVGLLPSFRTNRNPRGKSNGIRKTGSGVDIFEQVPPDSLHMLLPLWAGETDPASALGEDSSIYSLPVEERQYLLVYYVPFDERKEKGKKKPELNKKRSRGETSSSGPSTPASSSKTIILTSFRVCARLISYHDLLGTGVRLPIDGLSVTGPMSEAMAKLPPSHIREARLDDLVIGVCANRQTGMEFISEGLAKLGLCVPSEAPAISPIDPTQEDEESWELTPIGRAAVEMAWLGCLAMTSFGSDLQAR